MKITMYELLGLVKDGKAPKKIKYAGYEYSYYEDEDNNFKNYDCAGKDWLINQFIYQKINDTVEILEEEKKIPEKLIPTSLKGIDNLDEKIEIAHIDTISVIETLNQLIDYLKNKGE